jgi:nucleoid-associated protein YgaU
MRYYNQAVYENDNDAYKRYLKKTRGIKSVRQFDTPKFKHPSVEDMQNFKRITHIWNSSDRYYRLAYQYYSDPTKWWVIALYNQKPTEFHVKLGDTIFIPVPQ